jgi:very-short-patch-repair endonuclease
MTFLPYNKELLRYSRSLRDNATDAEKRLWLKLRLRQLNGYQFYRQKVIGDYIVDFFCPQARLIIEVDGSQHMTEDGTATDRIRDAFMSKLGFRVLRFNHNGVLTNIEGVVDNIIEYLTVKAKNIL